MTWKVKAAAVGMGERGAPAAAPAGGQALEAQGRRLVVRGMVLLVLGLVLAVGLPAVRGDDYYVAVDGSDVFGDGSEENPWATPQRAIVAIEGSSENPHTIHIGPGTYYGEVTLDNDDMYESLIGAGPDITILDAEGDGHVIKVLYAAGNRFEDMTLTNGQALYGQYNAGGGLFCAGRGSIIRNLYIHGNTANNHGGLFVGDAEWAEVSNCWIHHNTSVRQGGGIGMADAGSLYVHDNIIEDNVSEDGGGFNAFLAHNLLFESNIVRRNHATRTGGGGRLYVTDGRFTRNVIAENSAADAAAALRIVNSDPMIDHNLIINNSVGSQGIDCTDSFADQGGFIHNTVVGNASGLRLVQGKPPTTWTLIIKHNIFWDNGDDFRVNIGEQAMEFAFNIIEDTGEENEGPGVIHDDPQFVGPEDYHLRPESPAIDAGDPSWDFCEEPEPNGCIANLGAYGNTEEATTSSVVTCVPVYPCDIVPTPTATASPEPTVTATPTVDPNASPTPRPPTATPTVTPYRSPSPSPTWSGYPTDVWLELNASAFGPGEQFLLRASMRNNGETRTANLIIVLQVFDSFYFYPTWTSEPQWLETTLGARSEATLTILDFVLPDHLPGGGPFSFLGAMFDPGTSQLISQISSVTFLFR